MSPLAGSAARVAASTDPARAGTRLVDPCPGTVLQPRSVAGRPEVARPEPAVSYPDSAARPRAGRSERPLPLPAITLPRATVDAIDRFVAHADVSLRQPAAPVRLRVRPTIGPSLPAILEPAPDASGHGGVLVGVLIAAGLLLATLLGLLGAVQLP